MILTGNGKNTLRELLHQDKRYLLQLEVLEEEYKDKLNPILNEGETINLVPYGNHCLSENSLTALQCRTVIPFKKGRSLIAPHSAITKTQQPSPAFLRDDGYLFFELKR